MDNVSSDIVFYNGKIVTLDNVGTIAEAVGIKNGRFIKIGSNKEVKKSADASTRMVDLEGKTVVPGLIDAHCHPMETIMMRDTWVDCRYPGTPSAKQAVNNIARWIQNTPNDAWVFAACVSASQNKFEEHKVPSKDDLDSVARDNPVVLANGTHMAVVNTVALQILDIKKGTRKLPHGGTVILDGNDEPTGVLTDAMNDVPFVPTVAQLTSFYASEIPKLWNSNGFTSIMAITPSATVPVLKSVAMSNGTPSIRYSTTVWTSANAVDMPTDLSDFEFAENVDPQWYRFAAIKVWIDGENDARTGYMYEPYLGSFDTDPPGNKGTLVTAQPEADHFASIASNAKVAAMLHVAGDAAIDIGLNTCEKQINAGKTGNIMRLDHFGMFQVTSEQLNRAKQIKKHGVCICVQPTWLLDLVKANFDNMGSERASTGFRFRTMIDAGLEPAAGTDVTGIYLDNINPFLAIYAAVTRNSDMGVFQPEEAVSVKDALRMWTIWAAKIMGEQDVKGTIENNKYADMAVLSDDIFDIEPERLQKVRVLKTIVGGNIVYEEK